MKNAGLEISMVALMVLTFACAPKKPPITNETRDNSAAVLEINGKTISYEEYQYRLSKYPDISKSVLNSVEQKRDQLLAIAQFETLVVAAAREGYATDPRAMFEVKKALVSLVEQEAIKFDEAAFEEKVDDTLSRLTIPERRRVTFFEGKDDCKPFAESLSGMTFGERLDAFEEGENLGFVAPDAIDLDSPARKMAAQLAYEAPVGEVSVGVGEGFCVVSMATGRIESQKPDRDEIEAEIRTQMLAEARETLRGQ